MLSLFFLQGDFGIVGGKGDYGVLGEKGIQGEFGFFGLEGIEGIIVFFIVYNFKIFLQKK